MYPFIDLYIRKIPTYGLMLVVGVIFVFVFSYRRVKREGMERPMDSLLLVATCTMTCAILGANILYNIVTYSWSQIWEMITSFNFAPMGGLVFYGGLIGGILGAWIGSKLAQTPLMAFERAVVPFIPLGYGFGRIGCLLGGCCYGMPYDGIFAVQYPQVVCENHGVVHAPGDVLRFPTPLLDTFISILVCVFLVWFTRKPKSETGKQGLYFRLRFRRGALLLMYLAIYCVQRFVIEFFRGDKVRGLYGWFSTSQWISLAIAVVVAVLLVVMHRKKSKFKQ